MGGSNSHINESDTKTHLPHNYHEIVKDVDDEIVDSSSLDVLYEHLSAGVFLNQRKKKYWIQGKTNCFMLYARDLSITWAGDTSYWSWPTLKETRDVIVDAAELRNVCWLEVHGRFETRKLTPRVMYEVAFVVMLKDDATGFEVPVNLRLSLPSGSSQEHKEILMAKKRGGWIELVAGRFYNEEAGEIDFSLCEYKDGRWKKGLVIKGAVIRPSSKVA